MNSSFEIEFGPKLNPIPKTINSNNNFNKFLENRNNLKNSESSFSSSSESVRNSYKVLESGRKSSRSFVEKMPSLKSPGRRKKAFYYDDEYLNIKQRIKKTFKIKPVEELLKNKKSFYDIISLFCIVKTFIYKLKNLSSIMDTNKLKPLHFEIIKDATQSYEIKHENKNYFLGNFFFIIVNTIN